MTTKNSDMILHHTESFKLLIEIFETQIGFRWKFVLALLHHTSVCVCVILYHVNKLLRLIRSYGQISYLNSHNSIIQILEHSTGREYQFSSIDWWRPLKLYLRMIHHSNHNMVT